MGVDGAGRIKERKTMAVLYLLSRHSNYSMKYAPELAIAKNLHRIPKIHYHLPYCLEQQLDDSLAPVRCCI
jgi:hypothetical protein